MSSKKTAAKKLQADMKPKHVSAFSKGPFVGRSPIKGKDSRNILNLKGLQNGVVVMWAKKANKDEAAFLGPVFKMLKQHEETMNEIGTYAITARKGTNGTKELKQSPSERKWPWEQLVCVVGENNNTKDERANIAKKL